jgi:hypothetical protein
MNVQRHVSLVLWLAIITVTLARAAHAQPTISANPAEVIFYTKATSIQKSTVITWDADGESESPREVYYTTNGAGETLFANGGNGTKVADFIKLNNTYEFCLWGDDHQDKLKCATVSTKHIKAQLSLGFIKDLKVEPRGHSVRIRFSTVRSTLPVVHVSQSAPNKIIPISENDTAAFDPGVEVISHLAGGGLTHETIVPKLEPDTDHFFVISASDKTTGRWFKVSGKFHTLRRRVGVTFAKVKVVDDSDDLSPGDLAFGFFINGQNAPNGQPMTFGTHADTGSTKTANVTGSVVDAPATLTLKATGYDDDETEWIPLGPFVVILFNSCGTAASDPGLNEGENDCGDWTSSSKSFNLDTLAQNAPNPESFSQSFTIQARPKGDDSEVSFDVTGTVSVTFVP